MFVHAVYFWLKPDLTPGQVEAFTQGLASLKTIESGTAAYIGVPAPTDRSVIERSYSYALTVVFEDQLAHDRYQADPIHDRFREQCQRYWDRVLIYDSLERD